MEHGAWWKPTLPPNGPRHTPLQEQCQALQLQLEEQAREAGETEKSLKEEVGRLILLGLPFALCLTLCAKVARLQKELVQAEAATALRVREATEAERRRAEADLETFINTRSRLESELAEAEQQKINIEKALSDRKHDGGASASKDEKVCDLLCVASVGSSILIIIRAATNRGGCRPSANFAIRNDDAREEDGGGAARRYCLAAARGASQVTRDMHHVIFME
jgi:hypothetical protein